MDLIDKALQLYDEIESRQRQLREILEQLQALQCTMHDAQCPVQDEQAADDNSADNLVSTETLNLAPSTKTTEDSSLKESSSSIEHHTSSIEHKRPDLWKSLTINDRFRFRRELFAGDDAAMSEAINRISEMDTLSEADDYLSSMPWESDSEAVSEFMTILSNHFSRF